MSAPPPPRRPQLTLVGIQPPRGGPSEPGNRAIDSMLDAIRSTDWNEPKPGDHAADARHYLEQPFPLTPYADAVVYTPTHERPLERRTILPPARKQLPTLVLKRPIAREPSRVALVMAAVICCYVIALAMLLTF